MSSGPCLCYAIPVLMDGCGIKFELQKMAQVWCFVLLAFAVTVATIPAVGASTDDLGFISIDCGLPENDSYQDESSGIKYVSDAGYIDAGTNRDVPSAVSFARRYRNLRSFPSGTRNCYTFKSLTAGEKYLIRAGFYYGNYDLLDKQVRFDLYLGLDLWETINMNSSSTPHFAEVIVQATADVTFVCLVNTGAGDPFISGLDLRPVKSGLYPSVNASYGLVNSWRSNVGESDPKMIFRYPYDAVDRIWLPYNGSAAGTDISTQSSVLNAESDPFEAPSIVLKTALQAVNSTGVLQLSWTPDHGPNAEYYVIMYFSELKEYSSRQFNVYVNGELWYQKPFTPRYLYSDVLYGMVPSNGYSRHNVSLVATANSSLPPILNAMEVHSVLNITSVPSDNADVDAMVAIKEWYHVKENWMGDPCVPKDLMWVGVNCSLNTTSAPRITALNLSNRGLTGEITTSFAGLGAVEYLDLSNNNLTGPISASLAELPSLKILNLTNNELNGSIPSALITKLQNGVLLLSIEGNRNLCVNATSCEGNSSPGKKKNTVIVVSCIASVMVLSVVAIVFYRLRKQQGSSSEALPRQVRYHEYDELHQLENRQFTYKDLEKITNNFARILGKGGFGSVYHGCLEDGIEVAVKMRSHTSTQGTKEFLAEAQHLTRVHHKNLVCMIGYCIDGDYLALVYEYMSRGTLRNHLKGKTDDVRALSWRQRLGIAIEAAQGLEYLHTGCKPPIIHRDVKTANILLNDKLEAKLADFGLSKACQADTDEPISTALAGTLGYLDPEYYTKFHLSAKSDVYSFGVVLLELITGQPPIIPSSESTHIVEWVKQNLATGNIEDIIDARMHGDYDLNSIWKAADVALRSTVQTSHDRLSMNEVVVQLKDSLSLEAVHDRDESVVASSSGNLQTDGSEITECSGIEIEGSSKTSFVSSPSAR